MRLELARYWQRWPAMPDLIGNRGLFMRNDKLETARALHTAGKLRDAREAYSAAAAAARAADDWRALGHALRHLSDLARNAGDPSAALATAEEAVELYRTRSDTPAKDLDLANALRLRALAREASGQTAPDDWREAGDIYEALGIAAGVAEARSAAQSERPGQGPTGR